MRPYKPPVTVCKKIKCIDCRRNIVFIMGIVKISRNTAGECALLDPYS